eukprot:1157540-Pelagomonas_calceolata.AAC.8
MNTECYQTLAGPAPFECGAVGQACARSCRGSSLECGLGMLPGSSKVIKSAIEAQPGIGKIDGWPEKCLSGRG